MHPIAFFIASLALALLTTATSAQPGRQAFAVPTPAGEIMVEGLGDCAEPPCPAVLILCGARGFGSPAYDEIGQVFSAAGLDAYLVHVLTPADLDAIAKADGAGARIAYYAGRLDAWMAGTAGVANSLRGRERHGGKVGLLGISLGAQIASAAAVETADVDALVLVDGGFPNGDAKPIQSLPPLLLVWGSADRTFPLAIAREIEAMAQRMGAPVALNVHEGGEHDFFLRSGTGIASAARQGAADFLVRELR